jgi:signal transduction histidine kinase/ligand-binding sensor domain-containing protein
MEDWWSGVHKHLLLRVMILLLISLTSCAAPTEIPGLEVQEQPIENQNIESRSTTAPTDVQPPPSVRFEHLSVDDGLAHSEVAVIIQDRLGFLWFGTQNGLNKYDGHVFKTYRHDPNDAESLRDNFIESIYEDRSGTIWVGTQAGWLEKYDREADSFVHYSVSSHIYDILEDSEGNLWLGSKDPGLIQFDRRTGQVETHWTVKDVTALVEDHLGRIWAASPEVGIWRFDPRLDKIEQLSVEHPIHTMAVSQRGQIWAGTWGGGIGLYDPWSDSFLYQGHKPDDPKSPSNDYISVVLPDIEGNLWIGTYENGVDKYDPEAGMITHYEHDPLDHHGLSSNFVLSIFRDQSGIMWFGGGIGVGVNKLVDGADRFGHYRPHPEKPSLTGSVVTSITSDKSGDVWIGTFEGLDRWDRKTGDWKNYRNDPDDPPSLSDNSVRSVYADQEGNLWIGTEGGLDRYDRRNDGFVHYDAPVVMWMNEGPSGRFWLATKGGFYELDREDDSVTLIASGYAWKIMVLEDSMGRVWVGTSGEGLEQYNPGTGEWKYFQHDPEDASSLSNNSVETIHEDELGVLWIGTGDGLNRFDEEKGSFVRYYVHDGLADDRIAAMMEDEERNLWLGTNGGLSRFDPNREVFDNYTSKDGLQSNIFWRNAYHQTEDGEMFFGGDNGFNAFYPENIQNNPTIPPVVITGVSVSNITIRTDLSEGEELEFSYDENFLSFDFAALDYTDSEQNQYAYQMEGLDDEWINAGTRRHADYPNLQPGNYVFRVKGSNNDGIWNEIGTHVLITLHPPFWQTTWFIALAAAVLVLAGFGVYRLRVRNLELRSRELEGLVEERTKELSKANVKLEQEIVERQRAEQALAEQAAEKAVLEERNRLARDLHDSVTQSIYSSTLIAEAGKRVAVQDESERAQNTFQRLGEITQQALKEMRLLVYELRPMALDEVGLVGALQARVDAVERRAGVDARLIIDEGLSFDPSREAALYFIIQEALNNALKHASPTKVEVSLSKIVDDDQEVYSLRVVDDGRGFDISRGAGKGGLGLVGMQERVENLGGVFELSSNPGEGTEIKVTIPNTDEVWEDIAG